jgi:O-antigen/teichoic acid export membrane protein
MPLKVMSAFILFFSILGFVNSIFNAFNDFKANLIRSLVYEFPRLFFIILFVSVGLSVVGALLGFVVASFLSLVVLVLLLVSKYGQLIFGNAKSIEWKRVIRFTSYLTIGSITWVVFAYVDSVMIGILLPAEDVGYYRAAYTIVLAIWGVVNLGNVLFPVFTQLEGNDLKRAFDRAFKYNVIISFPIAFGLPLVATPFIKFVYGYEYLSAINVLKVLSLLLLRSTDFFVRIFEAKEMPEYPVYVNVFSVTLNIILNYFMIIAYGIIGAAIATIISNIFDWMFLGYLCNKFFGISPKIEYIVKPILAGIVMCYILSYLTPHTLYEGFLAIIISAIIYFSVLFSIKYVSCSFAVALTRSGGILFSGYIPITSMF